jgi:cytidylate kinase
MAAMQREFAQRYGAVMEGRDIGTVVVPQTPFKFFLDADVSTRAKRRWEELRGSGEATSLAEIERQIRERDERDRSRDTSPLTAADDAIHVATDDLEIDEVVEALKREVERRSVR